MTAAADPADELFHPVGDDPAWSESYYFNFVDPDSGVGAFTRMGFRPNDGWADALHAVYLPAGRVVFTYGRRTDLTPEVVDTLGPVDPTVGNLTLRRGEAFRRWDIVYVGRGSGHGRPDRHAGGDQGSAGRLERPGAPRHGRGVRSDSAEPHYAVGGAQGHFEQTGRVSGTIRVGDERWDVAGFGVRDKSWGPRTWQAPSGTAAKAAGPAAVEQGCFLNWFSMNFGADLALGGACGRTADGTFRGKGWIQRDGDDARPRDVTMTTTYDPTNPMLHESVQLRGHRRAGSVDRRRRHRADDLPDEDPTTRRRHVRERGARPLRDRRTRRLRHRRALARRPPLIDVRRASRPAA